jgi:hypothetical protein
VKVIDLHGVKHDQVAAVIHDACSKYDTPFVVITGNSGQMKNLVAFAANKFGLAVRDSIDNPGRVVIEEKQ